MGPGRSPSQWSEERERSKLVPINGHFRGIARALSAPVPQRAENMLVHIKLGGGLIRDHILTSSSVFLWIERSRG